MTPAQLERAIKAAHRKLIAKASTQEDRRAAAAELSRLNRMRSPEQVRKMELAMGLRGTV